MARKKKAAPKNQAILNELTFIARSHNGRLIPKDVVMYAKDNPKSALHNRFDWDVEKAAWKYWLFQADNIIRVVYTPILIGNKETKAKAFWSFVADRKTGQGYTPMVDILMGDKDMRDRMLQQALAELSVFQSKYHILEELCEDIESVKRKFAKPKKTKKRVQKKVLFPTVIPQVEPPQISA